MKAVANRQIEVGSISIQHYLKKQPSYNMVEGLNVCSVHVFLKNRFNKMQERAPLTCCARACPLNFSSSP